MASLASISGSTQSDPETISASSCSWNMTTSADGECFLEPRTCTECLGDVPTTGETCVLTEKGICLSVGDYEETRGGGDGAYYLAGNTTYCDGSNSSDCVRLDYCEPSTWLSYARERLPLIVLAVNESTPEDCSFATDTGNAVSGRSALSSDDSSLLAAPWEGKDTLSSDDKCTWYQNTTLCSTPRTCYDCLNNVADSNELCTITPEGYCATLKTNYNYTLDFRRSSSTGVANGFYYPQTNATYCEPSDAACSNCGIGRSATNSASYCVGSDDCVCVAFCQSADWQETVISEKCQASASSTNLYAAGFPWQAFIVFLSLAVVMILAVILGGWRVRQVLRERRRESMQSTRCETRRSTLELELPAWTAMREELIDKKVDPVGENRGRLRPM